MGEGRPVTKEEKGKKGITGIETLWHKIFRLLGERITNGWMEDSKKGLMYQVSIQGRLDAFGSLRRKLIILF